MKIAYNPSGASPLAGAPKNNNDIIFDLAGKAIYVKDVKLLGTDTVYDVFKKHTSSNGGGNVGLVPVPSYTNTNTRFLREDGTWVVPTNTTYEVFTGSTLENSGKAGLVPAPSAGFQKILQSDGTWTLKFLSYDIPVNSAIKITFYGQTHATIFMRHTFSNNMGVYHVSGYGSLGDAKRISIVEVTNSCSGIIYPVDGEFAVIIKNPETTNSLFVSATLLLGSISKIETVTSEVTKSDIWRNVLHSGNAFIKNGTININGVSITPLTQHQSLSNYVTLDTALVITGYKDFTRQVKISTAGNPLKLTSSTTYCNISFSITNSDGTAVGSGIVLRGNADFKIFDADWSNEYTILHSNNYTLYKHSYTNLTGSGTTANLAIVSTGTANGWTLKTLGSNAFDSTAYLPLTGGTLTGDLNFGHLSASRKGYITWTGGTTLQRIQISDNNNTNDAVFAFLYSTNSGTDWTDLFTIRDNGYVIATSFIGNIDGTYVNKLTGYKIATTRGAVAATDSLNTAIGKLEYKAYLGETAYDWYKSVTGTDNDDIINKWGEIVGFLDSVKEGTDILDEFVTRKTDLVITGKKTFYGDGSTLLTVKRNHESHPTYIHFADENESLGFIGISKDHKPVFHYEQQYTILHAGNSYIKNGVITINGTSITPLTLHLSLANYVTLDTYLKITGLKLFNTSTNTLPLLIARGGNGESEVLKIGIDDHNATFEFVNDETSNSFLFKLVNTDIENGGEGINANSSLVKFYGDADGSVVIANKFMGQLDKTLTFAAGAFTAKTYNNSSAVTVNVPTKTSHLTNDSGYLTSRGFIGTTAVQASSVTQSLTGIGSISMSGILTINTSITDHSQPTALCLVINSNQIPDGTTLTLKNSPGIGFHIASHSWGSLVFNRTFNFINAYATSFMPVKASKFITNGGTSSLFVKGDGSLDSNKYLINTHATHTSAYYRTTTVNGTNYAFWSHTNSDGFSIYAPTTAGTSGLILTSNGSGAPVWVNQSSISAVTSKVLRNYYSSRQTTIKPGITGDGSMIQYKCTSTCTDTDKPGEGHILHFNWDNGGWDSLLCIHTTTPKLSIRCMNSGTWSEWARVITSLNYTSYLGYIGTTAVLSTSKALALTGITNLTMSGNLTITPGNTDNFINFSYNGGSTYSWRLGYLGTGSGDTNYFVVQSAKAAGTSWNNVIRLGNETLDAAFGGNVYPLVTNTQTLGTSSLRWSNIYSVSGNYSGNLTLQTSSGDSPHLVFLRKALTDDNVDWDMYVTGDIFKLRCNPGTDGVESWKEVLSLNSTNSITTAYRITASTFVKSGSSDSYILLGGGNHKAVSDFLLKSELENLELNSNLYKKDISLKPTTLWTDVGDLGTLFTNPHRGTYAILVYCPRHKEDTIYRYHVYYSGIMSINDNTNTTNTSDEIWLHASAHASHIRIYLRTITLTGANYPKLLIAASANFDEAVTFNFKIKRLI